MPDDFIVAKYLATIKALHQERLYSRESWTVRYQRLVKAYCALEDKKNATKWAEKAAKLSRVFATHNAGWWDPNNTDWRDGELRRGVLALGR